MNKKIIGIAGGSASGKSTFANYLYTDLAQHSNVKLIAMDSYFKPENELPLAFGKDKKQYRDYNCPESFDFEKLKNDIKEARSIFDIVIIEGLLTLYDDEIYKMCNLSIFIDCPADIRIIRRIKRNISWGLSLEDITDVYLNLVRYRHMEFVEPTKTKADVLIDSSVGISQKDIKTIIDKVITTGE